MTARDGLGIWLGRGKRRPHAMGKPGCVFPCLVVLAGAAGWLTWAGHAAMGLL